MKRLLILLITFTFLVIWEVTASNSQTLKFFVSSPISSFQYAMTNYHNLLKSTLTTLIEALSGFSLAIFFSFVIMILCLWYPPILKIILPVFISSQVLPIITLAPLFIILFGMGLLSKIAMVVLLCFFPIFINFSAGVKNVSKNIQELLYVYNTGKFFRIFRIVIPLSTPYIFTGLKISTTMAVMGAIIAEFVGAKDGLGKNLYLAPKNSLPELMICSIVLTTFIGWALYKFVERIEKKLGNWYSYN